MTGHGDVAWKRGVVGSKMGCEAQKRGGRGVGVLKMGVGVSKMGVEGAVWQPKLVACKFRD